MTSQTDLRTDFRQLIDRSDFASLEERWMAEIEAIDGEGSLPDSGAFLIGADALLDASELGRAEALLDLTIPAYAERGELRSTLELLRRRCLASPESGEARSSFVHCFQQIHPVGSVEREYLKFVDLEKAVDLQRAFAELDRWMSLVEGSFVYHPAGWGAGKIESIDTVVRQAVVQLEKKPNHRMSLEALGSVLEPLDPGHYYVHQLEGGETLREMVDSDPVALVDLVLRSFGNPMAQRDVKFYLVPAYIPTQKWAKWWNATKRLLRKSGFYRIGDRAPYQVERLEKAVSYEEELSEVFARADWSARRPLIRKVLKDQSKEFPALTAQIITELERIVAEEGGSLAIAAACYLERYGSGGDSAMVRVLQASSDPMRDICQVEGDDEQKAAVAKLSEALGERFHEVVLGLWAEGNDAIRDELHSHAAEYGASDEMAALVASAVGASRLKPNLFLWSVRRYLATDGQDPLFRSLAELTALQILQRVFDLLEYLAVRQEREKDDETQQILSKGRALLGLKSITLFADAIEGIGKKDGRALYQRLLASHGLTDPLRIDFLDQITRRMPELTVPPDKPIWEQDDVIYVTKAGLTKREDELRDIMEEKLPETFEDIGRAAAFGDLRENAEYKAALEKRDFLTTKGAEIRAELDRAKLIGPEMLRHGEVTLGSKVTLTNLDTGVEVVYRVLGPWDGGPDEGVLSYKSPMARTFLGAKVGDELAVELPIGTERFKVNAIESGL